MSAALQQAPQLQVKLSVLKGPHVGQVFELNKDKIVIGRGPENDIVLMNDPQVSRLHAQIVLVDREFELVKISQKNAVLVDGQSVDKWKLLNGSIFTIGDTEFRIEYDLGQAIVSVQSKKLADVVNLRPVSHDATRIDAKIQAPVVKKSQPPQQKISKAGSVQTRPMSMPSQQQMQQQMMQQQQMQRAQQQAQFRPAAAPPSTSLFDNPKFRFYAVVLFIVGGLIFFLMGPTKSTKSSKPKATLKYEDEINIKMNSTPEKEQQKKREDIKVDRNSPQYLRARENLMKGMRDYNLGNYLRAIDFFQVVLNLESDNDLAKRHMYLSRVRFDELVQTKLMLGESYYNKHNFDMCASMYKQVMNMLEDRKVDTKYKLAERKAKDCELASEGIR